MSPFIRQVVALLEQPQNLRDLVRDCCQERVGVVPANQSCGSHKQQHVVKRTHDKPPMNDD